MRLALHAACSTLTLNMPLFVLAVAVTVGTAVHRSGPRGTQQQRKDAQHAWECAYGWSKAHKLTSQRDRLREAVRFYLQLQPHHPQRTVDFFVGHWGPRQDTRDLPRHTSRPAITGAVAEACAEDLCEACVVAGSIKPYTNRVMRRHVRCATRAPL